MLYPDDVDLWRYPNGAFVLQAVEAFRRIRIGSSGEATTDD
jgi:hypothetical protein